MQAVYYALDNWVFLIRSKVIQGDDKATMLVADRWWAFGSLFACIVEWVDVLDAQATEAAILRSVLRTQDEIAAAQARQREASGQVDAEAAAVAAASQVAALRVSWEVSRPALSPVLRGL